MSPTASTRRPLVALLRKEVHETLKWGVLGLLLTAIAVVGLLREFLGAFGSPFGAVFGSAPSIMNIYKVTSAIAPLVAMLIAAAQILPENRGDRWGFLVHRPADRSTLFLGKVIVGVLVYALAYGIPMACAITWSAMPGHLAAPFDSRMALPAVADLTCGVAFYFAGLLVAMRDARWYGSRVLGVGLAIVCWRQVAGEWSPAWWAFAWSAGGVAILGAAAWGTFVRGGQYERQPLVARAAVGFSVVSGLAVVGGIVIAIVLSLSFVSRDQRLATFKEYGVTRDAQLVQAVEDMTGGVVAVTDIAGHPEPNFANPESRSPRRLWAGVVSASTTLNPSVVGRATDYRGTGGMFAQVSDNDRPEGLPSENWFYIPRERLIAAYDLRTARLIGWLGPDGFSPGPTPPAARFPGDLEGRTSAEVDETEGPLGIMIPDNTLRTSLLSFPTAVFHVALVRREIERVFTPTAGDTVLSAVEADPNPFGIESPDAGGPTFEMTTTSVVTTSTGFVPSAPVAPPPPPPRTGYAIIATTARIYLVPENGGKPVSVARDTAARHYGQLSASRATLAPGTPTFLRYEPWNGTLPLTEWSSVPEIVDEIDDSAATIRRVLLPPTATTERTAWGRVIASAMALPLVVHAAGSLWSPVTGSPRVVAIATALFGDSVLSDSISGAAATVAWLVTILVALACAAFTYALGIRYAFSLRARWTWTGLGVALGPLGVLLMLAVTERPARETCPSCGKPRVVTNVLCEHCGSTFTPPPRDGTEIFDQPARSLVPAGA